MRSSGLERADGKAPQAVTTGEQRPEHRVVTAVLFERPRRRTQAGRSLLGDIARDYRSFFTTRGATRLEIAPMVAPGGGGVQMTVFRR